MHQGNGQWDFLSGRIATQNRSLSQVAGFVLRFQTDPPSLSQGTSWFTTENLWGTSDGILRDTDLKAWDALLHRGPVTPVASQMTDVHHRG
jgi:hypothetical protein